MVNLNQTQELNMSAFNPNDFLNTAVTASNSTSTKPIREHEAMAYVKDVAIRTPKESVILDITWVIDSAEAKEDTGFNEPQVRQSIFLDIDSSGHLDMSEGKNIQLGRVRKALNQNESGKPWAPSMMVGQPARVHVSQRPDSKKPDVIYNDIKSVVAA